MPIPTELVGSLPRPMKLHEAHAAYDEGRIGHEDKEEVYRLCGRYSREDATAWPRCASSA